MEKEILELIDNFKNGLIIEEKYQELLFKYLINSKETQKLKYYYLLANEKDRCNMLISTYNDNIKISMLDSLNSNYYKGKLIDSLSNDEIKIKYLSSIKSIDTQFIVVMNFANDDAKIKCLPLFIGHYQLQLICTLNSDEKKIKCLSFLEYYYKVEVIKKLKDEDLIIKGYTSLNDLDLKRLIIKYIEDKKVKNILITMLTKETKDKLYKDIFKTNKNGDKLLKKIVIKDIPIDISGDISVGVELEVCFPNKIERDNFIGIFLGKNIFNKWDIKYDSSVQNGIEITSPILFFDEEVDLKELYYICDILKKRSLFTDSSCGGHIHLGFDYFKSTKEFMIFLNLYQSVENILYTICNRANTCMREKANKYARYSKDNICSILNLQINNEKILDLYEYVKLVKKSQTFCRGYGLNMLNIGNINKDTIEFRFPNGEIDFIELLYNIRILTKLFESSRNIANNNPYYVSLYEKIINNSISEDNKFYLLLELLFDNKDVEKYIERYQKNKPKTLIKVLNN